MDKVRVWPDIEAYSHTDFSRPFSPGILEAVIETGIAEKRAECFSYDTVVEREYLRMVVRNNLQTCLQHLDDEVDLTRYNAMSHFLTGCDSPDCWDAATIETLRGWLDVRRNDYGIWTVDPLAIIEIRIVSNKLFLEAK